MYQKLVHLEKKITNNNVLVFKNREFKAAIR